MTYRTLLQAGLASSVLVLTGTALAMGPGGGGGEGGGCGGDCTLGAFAGVAVVALSEEASGDLLKMREEEKLARDVYATLGEQWGELGGKVFQITNSEQKHMDAMKMMLNRFEMTDPVVDDKIGEFETQAFSDLYAQLVEAGSESLLDALKVGAKIEELDLVDLRAAVAGTEDPALTTVYGKLQKATRNHLRAFATQIEANGGTYEAEHLTQAEFDKIAASAFERGQAGQAKGQGQGKGKGKGKGQGGQGMGQGQGQGQGGQDCGGNCGGGCG